MESVIKLLMLEDTEADVVLIQRVLKQSELNLNIKHVSNERSFVEALDSFTPDIVLSDHQLPQFSSIEALEICRDKFPFVPFILVTGAVSEEFAASIIKSGADDYLLKNNLKRLPTAITQAIEKKNTQESLQKSEANIRTIFDSVDTAFVLLDNNYTILSFNKLFGIMAIEQMQVQPKEGDSVFTVTKPDRHIFLKHLLDKILAGESIEYESEFNPGSGPWLHYRISPVRGINNNVTRVMSTITDITAQKKAEEAKKKTDLELQEAHQRLFFHIKNTPLGFIEWDEHYKIKSWSKRAEKIFGWTEDELFEREHQGLDLAYKEDLVWLQPKIQQLINEEVSRNQIQNRNYTKDGRVIWCEWFNSALKNKDGKIITFMSLVQDITERKTIENVLREYNDRFEILSKATNDAIWDWNIEDDSTIWNHGIETIFGYAEREVKFKKLWWKEKIHPIMIVLIMK